jgi:hypothetical protein
MRGQVQFYALILEQGWLECVRRICSYALKQMPLRQHAFVQDADNFNNVVGG